MCNNKIHKELNISLTTCKKIDFPAMTQFIVWEVEHWYILKVQFIFELGKRDWISETGVTSYLAQL